MYSTLSLSASFFSYTGMRRLQILYLRPAISTFWCGDPRDGALQCSRHERGGIRRETGPARHRHGAGRGAREREEIRWGKSGGDGDGHSAGQRPGNGYGGAGNSLTNGAGKSHRDDPLSSKQEGSSSAFLPSWDKVWRCSQPCGPFSMHSRPGLPLTLSLADWNSVILASLATTMEHCYWIIHASNVSWCVFFLSALLKSATLYCVVDSNVASCALPNEQWVGSIQPGEVPLGSSIKTGKRGINLLRPPGGKCTFFCRSGLCRKFWKHFYFCSWKNWGLWKQSVSDQNWLRKQM